jgi:hypothetical protein
VRRVLLLELLLKLPILLVLIVLLLLHSAHAPPVGLHPRLHRATATAAEQA